MTRRSALFLALVLHHVAPLAALNLSRRALLGQRLQRVGLGAAAGLVVAGGVPAKAAALPFFGEAFRSVAGQPGFQTPGGVKYYEMTSGTGPAPQWGDTVVCKFVQYVQRSSEDAPERIEDWGSEPLIFKHGNGRQIEGLEDGVHTMKVGGTRRLLVPARLAYTASNVGPLPRSSRRLARLEEALNQMEMSGQIIFDVTLVNAYRDEGDRGYYEDKTPDASEGGVPKNVLNSAMDAL